jgi:hypothetical protein
LSGAAVADHGSRVPPVAHALLLRPQLHRGSTQRKTATVHARRAATFTLENTMSARKQWGGGLALLPCFVLVSTIAALPGCGSKGGCSSNPTGPGCQTSPTPPPPPVQPPPVVVVQGSGSLGKRLLALIPFSTSTVGKIDVTVDWTFATDDVDVYLARGACSFDQFIASQCNVMSFSESTTAKPEKLSVPGAAAGSYVLLIGNLGPADESVAYQVVLSPSAGAGSASTRGLSLGARPAHSGDYDGYTIIREQ